VAAVIGRIEQAVRRTGYRTVGVSGGVAANGYLRERLAELARRHEFGLAIPRPAYCTDNAAMIAAAGVERFARFGASPLDLPAAARTPLA
jgi:N6-L-threonylcarbamoyladenine synthase